MQKSIQEPIGTLPAVVVSLLIISVILLTTITLNCCGIKKPNVQDDLNQTEGEWHYCILKHILFCWNQNLQFAAMRFWTTVYGRQLIYNWEEEPLDRPSCNTKLNHLDLQGWMIKTVKYLINRTSSQGLITPRLSKVKPRTPNRQSWMKGSHKLIFSTF